MVKLLKIYINKKSLQKHQKKLKIKFERENLRMMKLLKK